MPLVSPSWRALLAALLFAAFAARADVVGEVHALIAKGDLGGAQRTADAALAARPRDAQTRFIHALVQMEAQRNDEAMAAFTQLSQEYPELPEPYNNIALLHVRAGRLEQARQALDIALRNDPGHRAARANLGEVYLMLAVQTWEQAAANGPLDARLARKLESARALLAAARPGAR